MNRKQHYIRNIHYYKRYYLLIALAVVLTNTIITGSLLIGDSVRHTLVSRVDDRLGQTLTLITSGTGFMDIPEERSSGFVPENSSPLSPDHSAQVLFTNGFVPSGISLLPVSIWGIDSSLQAIAAPGFVVPDIGEVVINQKTADELSVAIGDYLVVRLPNTQMIPSGSLFVTDNYTASLRLRIKAIIGRQQSGNLSLRNEQTIPFNLFINRGELNAELELSGKCNIILSNIRLDKKVLSDFWEPEFSGIRVEAGNGYQEIVSDRIFIEQDIVSHIDARFPKSNHLFSYLVNDISAHGDTIPYSFVTAIDRFGEIELADDEILLSDYAARRINVSQGDTVSLAYFVSAELKILTEMRHSFIVKDIVPLQSFLADGKLSARFPGLHDVENCTDWDSDLPINMNRVEKEDENYWDLYRTTPKALIAYKTGASVWKNNYGIATGIRISINDLPTTTGPAPTTTGPAPTTTGHSPTTTRHSPTTTGHSPTATGHSPTATGHSPTTTGHSPTTTGHSPTATGDRPTTTGHRPTATGDRPTTTGEIWGDSISLWEVVGGELTYPRETGLTAAYGGVDFKSLFLSLAFFVIVAALLLSTLPLGGMLYHRKKELLLLNSLGYTSRTIRKIITAEITVTVIIASISGMFVAILYNRLVLYALGNIWRGAVHTGDFLMSIEPVSLLTGFVITLLISAITLWRTVSGILNHSPQDVTKKKIRKKWRFPFIVHYPLFIINCSLFIILLIANFFIVQSPALFMLTGVIGLIAAVSGYVSFIRRKTSRPGRLNRRTMFYKQMNYRLRNGVISITILASGLFIVFSVGLNRKNFSDTASLISGTGGFALWSENSVPLYHSLSTKEGLEKYGLSGLLPENISVLQFFRHAGDDASCLNLNRAPQPTVLGVDNKQLAETSFTFGTKISGIEDDKSVWNALSQKIGDYYPVIADQTVLQWGLMKSVGDTITLLNKKGEPVTLQFIGGLNNSVFQGNILMDKAHFVEIWGENGSEIMLVKTDASDIQQVKQLFSQALANYGIQLSLCNERLKEFNSVTDAYLTIFLMLGGLGLLIGLFGMLLILKKSLIDRTKEITLLSALGFDWATIGQQLFRESIFIPLYAIIAGTVFAFVAVISAVFSADILVYSSIIVTLFFLIVIAYFYTKKMISKIINRK
jgi:ABC-type antimicrobial peptide transport system permease subunit